MLEKRELAEVVSTINTLICQNSNLERFITSFIGVYDGDTQIFTYVNSGHNPPCLIDEDRKVTQLTLGSTILGIFPHLPHMNVGQIKIDKPVLLCAYTDGLTEIENPEGIDFGPEKLEQYMVENWEEKLPILHQRLLNRLEIFAGGNGFLDDITLFTVKINP